MFLLQQVPLPTTLTKLNHVYGGTPNTTLMIQKEELISCLTSTNVTSVKIFWMQFCNVTVPRHADYEFEIRSASNSTYYTIPAS
jgi:hypothetical protein